MLKVYMPVVLGVLLSWGILETALYFYQKETQPVPSVSVQLEERPSSERVFIQVKTTEELAEKLKNFDRLAVPRIYIENFPGDFSWNADPALFVKALLPYILYQNEQLEAERKELFKISTKIFNNQPLTEQEQSFFNALVTKYEVFEVGPLSQAHELLQRVDKVSPSLAMAQALDTTQGGKINLDAPFGIYKWNEKGLYDRERYPTLEKAVEEYVSQLNKAESYYRWRGLRTIHRPTKYALPGRVFLKGLAPYEPDNPDYIERIRGVYNQYLLDNLDFAKLEEGEN